MKIKWEQGKWQEMIGTVAVIFCLISGCQDDQSTAPQPESSPADSKNKAFEAIKSLGGKIHLDDKGNVIQVDFSSNQEVSDTGLVHLEGLTRLTFLELSGTKVTKEGVMKLEAAKPDCRIYH